MSMMDDLNPRQRSAAEASGKPLLIVAGAGTGKTKTLTGRIVTLIRRGTLPENICALTFTNKAAREIDERVRSAMKLPFVKNPKDPFGAPHPFLGTFHSLGARILRREARKLDRTPQFIIFDDNDSFQIVKKILKAQNSADVNPNEVIGVISAVKSGTRTVEELRRERSPTLRTALDVLPHYEEKLAAQNAFDFDDLIEKVVRIFIAHPEVLEKYRERFSHILVDEYQDVNNRQYELIRLLVGEGGRVSVVGDDQQTIYSWRGSNFEIFLNFEREWRDAEVVTLDQNYRSTGTIIDAASAVIQNNRRQKPKKLWTENAPGPPITLLEAADEEDEADWIASKISNFQFPISKHDKEKPPAQETIAILYRTNAQSRPIEQALIAAQVPYRIYGGLKFYERREVKDIVAALRYAANAKDEVSRERLEKTFSRTRFRELDFKLRELETSSPGEAIHAFLEATDYFEYVKRSLTNVADRTDNIAELIRFAGEFSDLTEFLDRVALMQATDDTTNDKEQGVRNTSVPVALMTVHLAKGLEFDRVFIAGCVEGILPHNRSLGTDDELEEERRLMYVAMTRARRELAVCFYDIPSRFISEIPPELLEFKNRVSDETVFSDDEERYITIN